MAFRYKAEQAERNRQAEAAKLRRDRETPDGVLLAALPLLVILTHWRWLKFKRKISWVSSRDNDVYRLIADRWNRLLQRRGL